jgi:glyoxylase I family protein
MSPMDKRHVTASSSAGPASETSTSAVQVLGLDHLNIRVADLERAIAFYGGVLGMQVAQRNKRPDGSPSLVAMRAGNSVVFLQPAPAYVAPADHRTSGLDHYSLEIEATSPEALVERLKNAGVEIDEGPVKRWGGHGHGTSVYVRDPDGHRVELKQYNLGG